MTTRRGPNEQQEKAKVRFVWDLASASAYGPRDRRPGVDSPSLWNGLSRGRGTTLRRAFWGLLAALVLAGGASAEERYTVTDIGGFGSTGRLVEFSSRYAWDFYEIRFDFGLDLEAARLTDGSKLHLRIVRRDGSDWEYTCKASRDMQANVNKLYDKGISVLAECRIDPRKFARAVELDPDLVGEPTLVFHAMVSGRHAAAGVQKGMYFMQARDISVGEMAAYAVSQRDPSNLSVLFASNMAPYALHPESARVPRFVP